jgi:hypothetical protein
MPLESSIVNCSRLSSSHRDEMFALYSRYYARARREIFLRDLAEKDQVILLRDACGAVAGFSTLKLMTVGAARLLFSGDTVVERRHWNTPALAGSFGHVMLRLIDSYGEGNLYWFLISKGYRTYRFLPVFFNRFYPACDCPTPPECRALLDAAATAKFGSAYEASAGVIRSGGERDCLKPEYVGLSAAHRNDSHVQFFLRHNAGYADGDELACMAEIARENLNRYAWRVIERTQVKWDE